MKAFVALLFISLLLCGCTNVSVRTAPNVDLRKYHRVFVEQPFNENHHIDELMAYELKKLGYEASSGPMTMMPESTGIVISYDARWTWDFTTYVIELDVSVRTAHTNKKLADARYYQPSARPHPPEAVVHDLMTRLFAKAK